MGDVEDTFTKQEIQAGYVTSGRDVLARQQQIVQQALIAASGAAGSAPRRRTGGGGPSGTGRASNNPVFPGPSFDEPAKAAAPLVPPPPGVTNSRSASVNSPSVFPTVVATNTTSGGTIPAPNTIARAASVGATTTNSTGVAKAPIGSAAQVARKGVGPGVGGPISAASVVAGVHNVSNDSPAPHTTLTPLTPLKRSTASKGSKTGESANFGNTNSTTKLTSLRTSGKKNGMKNGSAPGSPSSQSSSQKTFPVPIRGEGPSSIGGAVIAAPVTVVPPVGATVARSGINSEGPSPLASLGGEPLSDLGGEVFNGPLQSSMNKAAIGNGAPIGSSKDKWNSTQLGGDPVAPGPGGMWGNSGNSGGNTGQVGGSVIGGGFHGSGSSALASMLGINLPTGSGSLRESSDLWGKPVAPSQPPISALNGSALPAQGVIGPGVSNQNGCLIGGVTIGGGPSGQRPMGGGGNKSDIALLQSLLPGVHITSGSSYDQASGFGNMGGGGSDWNSAPGPNQPMQHPANTSMHPQGHQWNNGFQSSLGGAPIGAIGQSGMKQNQRQAPGSIW